MTVNKSIGYPLPQSATRGLEASAKWSVVDCQKPEEAAFDPTSTPKDVVDIDFSARAADQFDRIGSTLEYASLYLLGLGILSIALAPVVASCSLVGAGLLAGGIGQFSGLVAQRERARAGIE